MRVCMILEGCYPYVYGGVSSWMHQYIQAMPDVEFVLWCIGAKEEDKGKFKFTLPDNVVEVHEVFLDSALNMQLSTGKEARFHVSEEQKESLRNLFEGKKTEFAPLFELFQRENVNPVNLLMSNFFMEMVMELCQGPYKYVSFADFFFNIRSMMLPEMYLLGQKIPEADIYHATATGYSGLLGSLAKYYTKKPFVLTEHGIYTREREEELLRANWVLPYFRKQWIELFYQFSHCAYHYANRVTALFSRANDIQEELGCDREKLCVISNGIHYDRFCNIPEKKPNGFVDIGAVVRIAKIKDIKTMLYAFAEVKTVVPNARLHIMGDVDDEEYFEDCKLLIENLQLEDVIFTGVVNVIEYLQNIDFTILTSISEGQPLSVLESFAAGRCAVTTDVGCCRELIEGQDEFGPAGIVVPPINKEQLSQAMIQLCNSPRRRDEFAANGKKRAEKYFTHKMSMDKYRDLYESVLQEG